MYKPSLLLVATSVVLVYRVALVIVMLAMSIAHVNKYTYWNYFGQTFFYFALWLSMVTRYPYLYKLISLIVFPIVFGSVFFVQFFIEVVLQLDGGEQFISATTLDGGNASVGTVHTFDFLVHTCPVLDMFIVLCSGYLFELRSIVGAVQRELESGDRRVFIAYIFTAPLFPLAVYCTIFNPFKEYATNARPIIIVLCALAIYVFTIWWLLKILTSRFTGHFTVDNNDEDSIARISSRMSRRSDSDSDVLYYTEEEEEEKNGGSRYRRHTVNAGYNDDDYDSD